MSQTSFFNRLFEELIEDLRKELLPPPNEAIPISKLEPEQIVLFEMFGEGDISEKQLNQIAEEDPAVFYKRQGDFTLCVLIKRNGEGGDLFQFGMSKRAPQDTDYPLVGEILSFKRAIIAGYGQV